MSTEKRLPLTEATMDNIAGGAAGTARLYYVDMFGGDDVAGPFRTKEEAQAALEAASRKQPNERFIITFSDVPA